MGMGTHCENTKLFTHYEKRALFYRIEFKKPSADSGPGKGNRRMIRWLRSCVFLLLCLGFFPNSGATELKERIFPMPSSILQSIRQAIRDGNFSCGKKALFCRNFFELKDGRLLILVGVPDYLCASNSFMPVTVDDQGRWLAGTILPGAPSWIVPGPDDALWLATQWQVEGTFPALYRSLDGVDWQEIKLPENRDVDCCFEKLEPICFQQNVMRLKFASAETGKTAYWQAALDPGAVSAPVWQPVAHAGDGASAVPCSSVLLGQGSWIRVESGRSNWISFKKNRMYARIALLVPRRLE